MIRSRRVRVAGFAVAVGATAALIAYGVSSTSAYFTDSHPGVINASTGSVKVTAGDLSLKFLGLFPGEFQSNPISYSNTGTGAEDIWMVFPAGSAPAFNAPAQAGPIPLGQYGHFAVTAPDGSFTSYNLASNRYGDTSTPCTVDKYGRGGSDAQGTVANPVPYCPVPNAILLSWNLPSGGSGNASVTFGFTKLLKNPLLQGKGPAPVATFQIVATQHGIFPDDPNNP
jgi:hypothetical protein